jgi:hypothetical protein
MMHAMHEARGRLAGRVCDAVRSLVQDGLEGRNPHGLDEVLVEARLPRLLPMLLSAFAADR